MENAEPLSLLPGFKIYGARVIHSLRNGISVILWMSIAITINACSIPSVVVETTDQYQVPAEIPPGQGWWFARFNMAGSEQQSPDWYMGTLIAGEIIAPLLTEHRNDIEFWRIHRRAGRDGDNHVFSFIFYSSAETARLIYQGIDNNELLKQLISEQKITETVSDETTKILRPEISATSDENWSDEIQKTWPSYIMGASQMWLDLVTEYAGQQEAGIDPVERYQQVQKRLTEVWQAEGRHAWLHHLNALYAYQPLLMRY